MPAGTFLMSITERDMAGKLGCIVRENCDLGFVLLFFLVMMVQLFLYHLLGWTFFLVMRAGGRGERMHTHRERERDGRGEIDGVSWL